MITILVVDDDDIVAQTIERTLRRHNYQTMLARSGVEALQISRRHIPDLVILDVLMPGMNGYQVCREMRLDPQLAGLPILFLTAKGKESNIIEGLSAGADDYLSKPFNIEELILRVQAILRRTRGASTQVKPKSRVIQVGEAELDCRNFQLHLPHGSFPLTPVQFDLIYHLIIHAGEAFSTHQLLKDVWDYPYDTGSPDLVRVHVKNLRQRIEVDPNAPAYIRTVPGHGYAFYPGQETTE